MSITWNMLFNLLEGVKLKLMVKFKLGKRENSSGRRDEEKCKTHTNNTLSMYDLNERWAK